MAQVDLPLPVGPAVSKLCRICRQIKPLAAFAKNRRTKSGAQADCKACNKEFRAKNEPTIARYQERYRAANYDKQMQYQREYRLAKKEAIAARSAARLRDPHFRAKELWMSARQRAGKLGIEFSISMETVIRLVVAGRCTKTGVLFDFEPREYKVQNPRSPSLDRLDPKKGYTEENASVVIWAYNAGKGVMGESEFHSLLMEMVAGLDLHGMKRAA